MVIMVQTDAELVRGCQDGQKEMFDELVKRYHKPVYSYFYSRINDSHATMDLVQEVFWSAYSSLGSCTKPDGFSSWLFTIAKNRLLEWLRKRNHPSALRTGLETREIAADVKPTIDEKLAGLHQAIQTLPEEYQAVISMRFHSKMTCQEIASALGKPLGTVTSMLARAYQAIKKEMLKGSDM